MKCPGSTSPPVEYLVFSNRTQDGAPVGIDNFVAWQGGVGQLMPMKFFKNVHLPPVIHGADPNSSQYIGSAPGGRWEKVFPDGLPSLEEFEFEMPHVGGYDVDGDAICVTTANNADEYCPISTVEVDGPITTYNSIARHVIHYHDGLGAFPYHNEGVDGSVPGQITTDWLLTVSSVC